ncbi:16S rRNA pseudouridine(516) synthase RsuA [Thalassomonas sp. RHCl1]|uniref:16S rRNA pseudouridine(516) synthase RsuA n=1 Tax=Thalassomonas sp. RHCl1 TaxID=2995320 RepID=UPI00248B5253|nr:16S rRNA pseudouridine(516) synthase RsuA [Thalassomonas sp. RHCl1]
MRLDKYICKSTELTRNEAKKLLKTGLVTVNDEVVKNGALQLSDTCQVAVEGQLLSKRSARYIMMFKPLDTICSNVDEVHPSVLHFLDVDKAFDLHIAGRLDVDTTGLVLITDDGQWSHQITSPRKACQKRYRVWLDEPVAPSVTEAFARGVQLKGESTLTQPAQLEVINEREVLLTIMEGKYHQVKRMFAAVGNHVVGLHREKIGEITLDEQLEPGQWRYLTEQEVASVRR